MADGAAAHAERQDVVHHQLAHEIGEAREVRGVEAGAAGARVEVLGEDEAEIALRRHAVRHQGPAGWRRSTFGLQTSWTDSHAVITVFAANPLAVAPDPWLVFENLVELELAKGFRVSGHRGPFAIAAHHRLEGRAWVVNGSRPGEPERQKQIAVLTGDRYVYALQLDVVGREHWPSAARVFEEVARSIEPVPAPESAKAPVAAMAHWLE